MPVLKASAATHMPNEIREFYNNIAGAEDSIVSLDKKIEDSEKIELKVEEGSK